MSKATISLIGLYMMMVTPVAISSESHDGHMTTWKITPSNRCESATFQLPLPALDLECDLDSRSGNPSKWFNPMATCELSFDLIGLPSIGDIMGGISGAVCDAVKTIKDKTIDKVIDDINQKIPDDLTGNIGGNIDMSDIVNDYINGSGSSGGTIGGSSGGSRPETCYITDSTGATIQAPCSLTNDRGQDVNQCYLRADGGTTTGNFTPIACDRPTPESEICILKYEQLGQNEFVPVLGNCAGATQKIDNACYGFNEQIVECGQLQEPATQYNRICRLPNNDPSAGATYVNGQCIEVEKSCFGHINGQFQANECRIFTDQSIRAGTQGSWSW
ncbi:hypothetical protein QTV44_002612 [Vibrio vulnificus]|nr:hypothetical protein [Vibrio vulnificus]